MSSPRHDRHTPVRRRATGVAITAAALTVAAMSLPASAAPVDPTADVARSIPSQLGAGRYLITFAGQPAASYTGGVAGMAPTAPRSGQKLNSATTSVRSYVQYLQRSKRAVLKSAGVNAFVDYSTVLNGVAANLTAQQAAKLAKDSRVVAMEKDTLQHVTTDKSPDYLGLPALWSALGGRDRAGSGVVVGVLDSGIWPESQSFSPNGTPIPSSFTGACETGEGFTAADCNGKIVGARYYVDGYGADNVAAEEYLSPRDGSGHGSHTASTAAGNRVDDVTVDDSSFGTISGMAPGAKIAAYKVCWTAKEGGDDGCKTSDIVAAIDDAVRDGVDVINFSIGGTTESRVTDSQELAFLNAAAAGVFVAASAGNSGPGASTLDHPSPWLTTVAASTHKISEKVLELADGRRFVGASSTPELPDLTPMVLAADSAAASSTSADAKLCQVGSLDPAKVTGKLVVCERGVNPRVEKSLVVKKAGGVGMVLVNATKNSLNADLHYVPSIHLQNTYYADLTAYVRGGGQGKIVAIRPGESTTKTPEVAEFSSRGPSTTTGGNILKPDLAAPGVDVLAAVTPYNHEGRNYDLLSGTSMAAPHVAGLAALLIQAHPSWSPMAIKSALMTTARDHVSTANPFDQGAGFVRPTLATDPGVVFDAGVRDWIGYLKSLDALKPGAYPGVPVVTGSDLNQASIAVGDLASSRIVTRTLTSVSWRPELYRFAADVPGFQITSTPSQFLLKPGESQTVKISIRRTTAAIGAWATGSVVYSSASGPNRLVGDAVPNNGHIAQLPVALRPVVVATTPAKITGTGASGQARVTVTPGVTGTLTTAVAGLIGVTPQADTITEGVFDLAAPQANDSTDLRTFEVPAGTAVIRFDTVVTNKSNDLDLFVYRVVNGTPRLVGGSATSSGDESTVLSNPVPGTYQVYVNGYTIKDAGDYTFRGWVVPNSPAGNLTATPASVAVRQGDPVTSTLAWTGLDQTQVWFGVVRYAIDGTIGSQVQVTVGG